MVGEGFQQKAPSPQGQRGLDAGVFLELAVAVTYSAPYQHATAAAVRIRENRLGSG